MIETPRLLLRHFEEGDLEALASLLADPEVMRFSLGKQTLSQAQKTLQNFIKAPSEKCIVQFALVHKESGAFVGFCGIFKQEIDGFRFAELGYRLVRTFWGQGYAYEAAVAVKKHAEEKCGIHELYSIIEPENLRSIRLAENLGAKKWKETLYHGLKVHLYKY